MSATATEQPPSDEPALGRGVEGRSVALVGLMGAGKTTVGRRIAAMLDLPFVDSDDEIVAAARMTIPELFARYGEPEFRALEARIVARILEGPRSVVSTGGGAFMREETRERMKSRAVTVWLRADLDTLMERVGKRPGRPLLQAPDPRAVMQGLIEERYPIYALADLVVDSRNVRRETVADEIVEALKRFGDRPR